MTPAKSRADRLLVALGLAESRARAQSLIKAGKVFAGQRQIVKPGETLPVTDSGLRLAEPDHPWVSRGGLKLAGALDYFELDVTGANAVDVGASTGGFTDVLLSGGAAHIYAVDVGQDQLHPRLRDDDRVTVLEKTNARHLDRETIPGPVDLIVCDASFISLKLVLPAAMELAEPGARLVALIKPQFEVGKGNLGKGGVVRDPALRQQACDDIFRWMGEQPDWSVVGVTDSPITGPDGNHEYLIYAVKAA